MEAMNKIIPFKKEDEIHPAAFAAAQLILINNIMPGDFFKALNILMEENEDQ